MVWPDYYFQIIRKVWWDLLYVLGVGASRFECSGMRTVHFTSATVGFAKFTCCEISLPQWMIEVSLDTRPSLSPANRNEPFGSGA
jgi:hypothetical protein